MLSILYAIIICFVVYSFPNTMNHEINFPFKKKFAFYSCPVVYCYHNLINSQVEWKDNKGKSFTDLLGLSSNGPEIKTNCCYREMRSYVLKRHMKKNSKKNESVPATNISVTNNIYPLSVSNSDPIKKIKWKKQDQWRGIEKTPNQGWEWIARETWAW